VTSPRAAAAHLSRDLTETPVGGFEARVHLPVMTAVAAIDGPTDLPLGGLTDNVGASRKNTHSIFLVGS
jgi:hypothetical protein